jgi:hypothetical protein
MFNAESCLLDKVRDHIRLKHCSMRIETCGFAACKTALAVKIAGNFNGTVKVFKAVTWVTALFGKSQFFKMDSGNGALNQRCAFTPSMPFCLSRDRTALTRSSSTGSFLLTPM